MTLCESEFTQQDLQALEGAHTGTDLETVCWAAAQEIISLRAALDKAMRTKNRDRAMIKDAIISNQIDTLRRYTAKELIYLPIKGSSQ